LSRFEQKWSKSGAKWSKSGAKVEQSGAKVERNILEKHLNNMIIKQILFDSLNLD
jgi:hypothetical protein